MIPGSKEALEKVLNPLQKYERRLPFTFLSNGGGYSEYEKAEKMNAQIGLGGKSLFSKFFGGSAKAPKLTENEIVLCHTILRSESIQKRFANEWVLVDGYASDDAEIAMSYGFKKVITLKELMSVETTACPCIGFDL